MGIQSRSGVKINGGFRAINRTPAHSLQAAQHTRQGLTTPTSWIRANQQRQVRARLVKSKKHSLK